MTSEISTDFSGDGGVLTTPGKEKEVIRDEKVGKTFIGVTPAWTREYRYSRRKGKAPRILQSWGVALVGEMLLPPGRGLQLLLGLLILFLRLGPWASWYLQCNLLAGAHAMSMDEHRTQTAIWQKGFQRFRITNLSRKSADQPVYYLYRRASETWVLTRDEGDWRIEVPTGLRKHGATDVLLFSGLQNPAQEDAQLAASAAKARTILGKLTKMFAKTNPNADPKATLRAAGYSGADDLLAGVDKGDIDAVRTLTKTLERSNTVAPTEGEGSATAKAAVAAIAAVVASSKDKDDPLAGVKVDLERARAAAEATPLPVADSPVVVATVRTDSDKLGAVARSAFGTYMELSTDRLRSVVTVDLDAEETAGLTQDDHVALLLAMRIARSTSGVPKWVKINLIVVALLLLVVLGVGVYDKRKEDREVAELYAAFDR